MEILVDKRTELMSIVLVLSQGNDYIQEHFCLDIHDGYREEVAAYFSKYKSHKCVELAKDLSKQEGFNYDNPMRLAFCLDKKLKFHGKIEDYLLFELNDINLIKEFMQELANFAEETNFNGFYNQHKSYYLSKIKEVKSLFNIENFVSELQIFLKRKVKEKFKVNIIPMLVNANHGFCFDNCLLANIGLLSEDLKGIEPFNKSLNHDIIHEFCHNFVNPNTENEGLQIPTELKTELKKYGYGNPKAYLNDTIVRAMTIRLREKIYKIDVSKFLELENRFGFVYVKDFYYEILNYEKQNITWEKYFPKFLSKFFEQKKRRDENNLCTSRKQKSWQSTINC